MSVKPIFISINRPPYCKTFEADFEYNKGLATAQKQKNIIAIHDVFTGKYPGKQILEISAKATHPLGLALCAFQLEKQVPSLGKSIAIENIYQASQIFEKGGPFLEIYDLKPKTARKFAELKTNGKLIGFRYEDQQFPPEPKTGFYTFLYVNALMESKELAEQLLLYDAFTDIDFNSEKNVNSAARAAAVFVALSRLNLLEKAQNYETFAALFRTPLPRKNENKQMTSSINLIKGDITTISRIDAIVSAGDTKLSGSGSLDKPIHKASGKELKEALKDRTIRTGEAIITASYNLESADYIIHTAGPKYNRGNSGEKELLQRTYQACLDCAKENGLYSIAFPCISVGAYRYPKVEAAKLALQAIRKWFENNTYALAVTLVCATDDETEVYQRVLSAYAKDEMKKQNSVLPKQNFEQGQTIYHKVWGEGILTQVTETQINVQFSTVGKKVLMRDWVNKNCRVH
ncbi:MAG: macro domain-containing protein [Negativicutes bacterium]|nr:macro domain-containing protein [Negativicutes bacterium]